MDSVESSNNTQIAVPDPSSREHLISTAVKFLQNPRVRPTTLSQKKIFLLQKGLTEQEVEIAIQNAGAYSDTNNNFKGGVLENDTRISLWIKAKDVANLVALISIGSYSLYSFWKRYLAPRFFGHRSRQEQNYEKLLNSILKLNENVVELKELIRTMQQQQVVVNSQKSLKSLPELVDVKNELSSIKSLLLSRSQFPSSPGIPSWQMIGGSNCDESSRQPSEENSPPGSEGEKSSSRKRKSKSGEGKSVSEGGGVSSTSLRKHPSLDSNNGLQSGESCEIVFKNDSDPDIHSDD